MRLIDADVSFKEVYFHADAKAIYPITERINYKTLYGLSLSDCERIVRFYLDNAPTVDPVKHGRWIVHTSKGERTYGECSLCNSKQYAGMLNYCPYCGAKMDEAKDEKA